MAVEQQVLLQALQAVPDPHTGKDFVSTKAIKNLQIQDGDVAFDVELGYPAKSEFPALRKALVAAARTVPGVDNVSVNLRLNVVSHAVQRGVQLLPGVPPHSPDRILQIHNYIWHTMPIYCYP